MADRQRIERYEGVPEAADIQHALRVARNAGLEELLKKIQKASIDRDESAITKLIDDISRKAADRGVHFDEAEETRSAERGDVSTEQQSHTNNIVPIRRRVPMFGAEDTVSPETTEQKPETKETMEKSMLRSYKERSERSYAEEAKDLADRVYNKISALNLVAVRSESDEPIGGDFVKLAGKARIGSINEAEFGQMKELAAKILDEQDDVPVPETVTEAGVDAHAPAESLKEVHGFAAAAEDAKEKEVTPTSAAEEPEKITTADNAETSPEASKETVTVKSEEAVWKYVEAVEEESKILEGIPDDDKDVMVADVVKKILDGDVPAANDNRAEAELQKAA